MKKNFLILLFLGLTLSTQALFHSVGISPESLLAQSSNCTNPASNSAPVPTINTPTPANRVGTVGVPMSFGGSATDTGGSISITSYNWSFGDGTGAGGTSASHVYSTPGTKTVTFSALDWCGASGSTSITVTINSSTPSNNPPSVNAGPDQTISSINFPLFNLNATVTDDGLPNPPGALTYTWSQVSGPTSSIFTGASTPNPSVGLQAFGTYIFRLTVWDGAVNVYDDVTVVANQAANNPPSVNAGNDQSVVLPAGAYLVGSVSDDNSLTPYRVWSKTSGPGSVTFSSVNGNNTWAYFSVSGTYVLRLTANDGFLEGYDEVVITVSNQANSQPNANAGSDKIINSNSLTGPFNVSITNASVYDDGLPNPPGALTNTWSKVSGPGTVNFSPSNTTLNPSVSLSLPGVYILLLTTSDSVLSDTDEMVITINQNNASPAVDAGPNRTIYSYQTNTASLDGTVNDDGLPNPPGALTNTWSKVSGPGTVTFGNFTSVDTTASFSQPGTYVLKLNASDSLLSAEDTVTVSYWQNNPPTANAGPDQTVTAPSAPANVSLSPTASNPDGLPAGGQLYFDWVKVSGPGNVTFSNSGGWWPPISSPSVTLSQFGTYVLRLIISDGSSYLGGLSASDEVTITLSSGGTPTNTPPVVSAQATPNAITLPVNQVFLDGTVTDNNLSLVTYLWTQVSGPSGVSIASPAQVDTNVTFTQAGTYKFKLTANDAGVPPFSVSSSDVTVTINPFDPCTGNLPPQVSAGPNVSGTTGAIINFAGSSSDPNGNNTLIDHVWNFGDNTPVVHSPNATAAHAYSQAGTYTVTLMVTDSCGATSSASATATINVVVSNQAPNVGVIVANPASVTLPNRTVTLSAPITDDRLPNPPAQVTVSWSQVGGLGTSFVPSQTIHNSGSFTATTSATLPNVPGTYTLRLTASDGSAGQGGLTSTRDVTVTVNPAAPQNQPPVVTASSSPSTITLPANQVSLFGNYTDDGLPAGRVITTQWSLQQGPLGGTASFANQNNLNTTTTLSAIPGTYVFKLAATETGVVGGLVGSTTVPVIVNPVNDPCAGNQNPSVPSINYSPSNPTVNQVVTFNAFATDPENNPLTYTWNFGDTATGTGSTVSHSYATSGTYSVTVTAKDACHSQGVNSSPVVVTVSSGSTTGVLPRVNAGVDQLNLSFPTTVSLAGSVVGFPSGYSRLWTKVAGPGTVSFGSPNGLQTTATFSSTGLYVLKLTATSGSLVMSDTLEVVFNQTVSVSAGIDRSLNLSPSNHQGTLTFDASVTASDLSPLSYSWSQVSGPVNLTITNGQVLDLNATAYKAGTYVLRLTVSGPGVIPSSDTVTLSVRDLEAGANQSIVLPASVSLSGTASNFPVGTVYQWSQFSGPVGGATFSNQNSPNTNVSFSQGNAFYQLRLTATPPGESPLFDTVQVWVAPVGSLGVNAGTDQLNLVYTSPSVTRSLSGVVVNAPSGTTYKWTKLSGPSGGDQPTFLPSDTVLNPSVTLYQTGNYTFQLKATPPSGLAILDTVSITFNVNPSNISVEASPNYLTWPQNSTNLNINFSDSNPELVSGLWTQFQGPIGQASFASPTSFDTTVTFGQVGNYDLRMTIDDGLAYDPQITREVKVYAACGPSNQKPTAFANADQWVQVNHGSVFTPFSSVGVGSVGYTPSSDSDGTITSYYWDFGDGSFGVQGNTSHSYAQVGTYIATLAVADNCGLIDTEEVVVHVVPVNPGEFNPILKVSKLEAFHPATGEEIWAELSGPVISVETGDLLRLDLLSSVGGIGLSNWVIGNANTNAEVTQSGLVQKVKFFSPSLLTHPASVTVYSDDASSLVILSKNFDVNNVMAQIGVGPGVQLSAREMTINEDASLAWAIHSEPDPCIPGDTFGPQCMTLTQLDLSDEDNITVNEYLPNTISNPTSLAYSHGHLYLRDGTNIKIFGVSANTAPQYQGTYNLGSFSTGGTYKGVAAMGQVLFSTAGNLGLKVLDLRSTPNLSILGQTPLPNGEAANMLFLDGNRLYIGGNNHKVHVLDLSCLGNLEAPNTCSPTIIGSVDVGDNISFLTKTGFGSHDYVLVYTYSGVKVYDITNPGQIVQVGEFGPYQVFGANATGVLAFGSKLYFGFGPTNLNHGTSVARINLANPSEVYAMEWISTSSAGGNRYMVHQGGKLYVTSDTNDIIILDLLNE